MAMAIISGSHCRQTVVLNESFTKVHAICRICSIFDLSPFKHFTYFNRKLYGCSTCKSNLIVWSRILSSVITSSLGSSPKDLNCGSKSNSRAFFIISIHFLGVSSTFPAKKRQQHAVTYLGNVLNE